MTLRARLTAAFLAAILGPVLLGAIFLGSATSTFSRQRATDRLGFAAAEVRVTAEALCQRLAAAAGTAAADSVGGTLPAGLGSVVNQGLAGAVRLERPDGIVLSAFGTLPGPWADCTGTGIGTSAGAVTPGAVTPGAVTPGTVTPGTVTPGTVSPGTVPPGTRADGVFRALSARVEVHDAFGRLIGYVRAATALDVAALTRLAAGSGADVTLLDGTGRPALGTGDPTRADRAASAARRAGGGRSPLLTRDGQYVRPLRPTAGQPLSLLVTVPARSARGPWPVLFALVLLSVALALGLAWAVARSTTRPLARLAAAADSVAGRDLSARVPVRGRDEVARLAATFNRMARETQTYVEALSTSRDQLRNNLAVLGTALSSTHDLGRIFRVILRSAVAATGARAGMLLLVDPVQEVLVGQCGVGLIERGQPDPTRVRLLLGDGLLGSVAESGVARRGRVERDGPTLSRREPRCVTYVAIPFSASRAQAPATGEPGIPGVQPVRGVLVLYDRLGSDEFDEADVRTLSVLAGRAAAAAENVRIHEETKRLSVTDPLTGLRNYRFLQEQIRTEVERATRFNRPLCVLALDLDRFKEVNDTFGHSAGDAVLAEFARRIRMEIREVDVAFRQGGEEFVVLLPETDRAGGVTVAERLRATLHDSPIVVVPRLGRRAVRIPVTVSVGVAVFPTHAVSAQQALEAADRALYRAKEAGRDTYRVAGRVRTPVPGGRAPAEQAGKRVNGTPVVPASGGASSGTHPPRQTRGR